MNKVYQNLIGKSIQIELSGKRLFTHYLIDAGTDIIVLYNGTDYVYVPILHIQHSKQTDDIDYSFPTSTPDIETEETLSLRKVLMAAKGMFTEIFVMGTQPIHGYVTGVMNNYFIFYSPVYKTMYIPLHHLKWLIPFSNNQKPFGLNDNDFPVRPSTLSLARTFDVQLQKLIGNLIIFNSGENLNVIGQIIKIQDGFIEFLTAREDIVYLNLEHIKTVHQP